MASTKKNNRAYSYGNVAYDLNENRVVKKKKKRKRVIKSKKNFAKRIKLISSITCIFLVSFMLLCRFATILNMSSDIRQLKKEIVSVQKENENIKVDIAKKDNIKNIEKVAVEKYGMIQPENQDIVFMDVKPLIASNKTDTKITAFEKIQKVLGLIY